MTARKEVVGRLARGSIPHTGMARGGILRGSLSHLGVNSPSLPTMIQLRVPRKGKQ